jgi:hypothetical protein
VRDYSFLFFFLVFYSKSKNADIVHHYIHPQKNLRKSKQYKHSKKKYVLEGIKFFVGPVPPGMVCVDLLASAHLGKVTESFSKVGHL